MQLAANTIGGQRPPFARCPIVPYSVSPPSWGPDIFSFNALSASRSPNVDFSVCWLMFSMALLFEGAFFLPELGALSSSADHVALCESTIRRSSFENSSTLKSSDSPTSTLSLLSCFCRFLAAQKPSMPYGNSRMAPLSFLLMTVHLCTEPTVKIVSNVSHGFSSRCLWLSASLRLAASSSSTTTSISSPTLTNSEGCLIFFVQLRSDTCTRPSMPSSSSMNRPKLVRLRIIPLWRVPTAYLVRRSEERRVGKE